MYIGLTGNIASGKSSAAKFFEKLGCYLLDADEISRVVMQPGGKAYAGVVKLLGEFILKDDNTLNRQAIRKIVFEKPDMRRELEQIVQPEILAYERREVGRIKGRDDKAIIITQAAVTVEAGTQGRFDRLIVVYADHDIQLKRLMARDCITQEEAEKMIGAQMPIDEKIKYAHFVIDNSDGLDELEAEVNRVYELIKFQIYGEKNG